MEQHDIKVSELLEGATTLIEVSEKLLEKAAYFESLAGQGYTLKNDEIKDGYGWLIKPDNTLTNDRDRLASAFMDLQNKHQFVTPLSWAWEASCVHDASDLLEERYPDLGDNDGLVFWTAETDDDAFGYQGWSNVIYDLIPKDKGTGERDAWIAANSDFIKSQEIAERLSHHTLVAPLPLYWRGDSGLIASVLREHGLTVIAPEAEENCVIVVPGHIKVEEVEG